MGECGDLPACEREGGGGTAEALECVSGRLIDSRTQVLELGVGEEWVGSQVVGGEVENGLLKEGELHLEAVAVWEA